MLDRYIAAFEAYDIDKLVELFTADAIWEMPPFAGLVSSARRPSAGCPATSARRRRPAICSFIPTVANGQPAAAMYMRDQETGQHCRFSCTCST